MLHSLCPFIFIDIFQFPKFSSRGSATSKTVMFDIILFSYLYFFSILKRIHFSCTTSMFHLKTPEICNYFDVVVDLKLRKHRDHTPIFTFREIVLIQNHQKQLHMLEEQFTKCGSGGQQGQTYFHNDIKVLTHLFHFYSPTDVRQSFSEAKFMGRDHHSDRQ